MSKFWEASDHPAIAGLTEWCEAEVERACRDSWEHMTISYAADPDEEDGTPKLLVFMDSPWDEVPEYRVSIAAILDELAQDGAHGITGEVMDVERIEPQLAAIERKIAEIRSRYQKPAQGGVTRMGGDGVAGGHDAEC